MIKKLSLFGLAVAAVVFSGCTKTYVSTALKPSAPEAIEKTLLVTTFNREDSDYGMKHLMYNNHKRLLIQQQAEATLFYGFKYFRIVNPIDSSAEMLTTGADLQKRCFSSGVGSSFVGSSDICFFKNGYRYAGEIVMYKERPSEFLVIDAQEVVDYLKANEMFTDLSDVYSSAQERFATKKD